MSQIKEPDGIIAIQINALKFRIVKFTFTVSFYPDNRFAKCIPFIYPAFVAVSDVPVPVFQHFASKNYCFNLNQL